MISEPSMLSSLSFQNPPVCFLSLPEKTAGDKIPSSELEIFAPTLGKEVFLPNSAQH